MKSLYVIDAAGYLYRSYFAIRSMTNDQGESTNALFGFVRSLLKLFKELSPDYCVAVFDGPNNSQSRSAIYPNYKAHRAGMPPDLLYQIHWAKEFCDLYGISQLSEPNVEADDTLAAIALWAEKQHFEVFLCTSDKDLTQVVNDKIKILDTFKDNLIMDIKGVEEKFGVPPHLIRDYLALTGDSSDNVPGVPGIGPKSAAELLNRFGSLENLLNNLSSLPDKKREIFELHKDSALISQKLVTLETELDFPKEESFYLLKPLDKENLKAFYTTKKFNSLIRELEAATPTTSEITPSQMIAKDKYHLVQDLKSLKELLNKLSRFPEIAVQTATTDPHPLKGSLLGISIAIEPEEAWYIPLNGPLDQRLTLELLKPFFADPKVGFYGHNIKHDLHVLKKAGIPLGRISFDTILASYILNSHSRRHALDDLSLDYFGMVKTAISSVLGKGKQQIPLEKASLDIVKDLFCENVDYIVRLKKIFELELKKRNLDLLFETLELPLTTVLADMEERGIYLDESYLKVLSQELAHDLERLSHEIYSIAGESFNLNSPLQISKILFEKLQLRSPRGSSTSAEVLDALKDAHPIVEKIQEYRFLEKLRSTYVDVLPEEILPETHRIHCTFNQSVAATGRLSCQNPNLQNIPIRSELGLKIREAFRPEKENWSFLAADYSQIELRLLAHLSDDPILIAAFRAGEDIHQHTASVVFHVPLDQVTKEMRFRAKAVNFGILYGQGPFGLSQAIGISQKEASQFISMYFQQYPKVKAFLEGCKDSARVTGKAVTLTGRERSIPEINSKNIQIRNAAERLAINTPFQGSAADLIKKAMLEIHEDILQQNLKGRMILQIHDELIFEVPDSEITIFKKLVKDRMEQVISLKIPLIVDIVVGKNWKEC